MATPRFTSATGGFVPAQTGLVISYIRDPKDFALNEYCQYIESDATVGLYSKLERDNQARDVADGDNVWADGSDSPSGNSNLLRWELREFATKRRAFPFEVGDVAVAQTKKSWDIVTAHSKQCAQQAITKRTNRVITMLETTSNWEGHAMDANTLNGGAGGWDTASDDPASANYNAIRKTLLRAAVIISLDTNSIVQMEDLVLVISPGLAEKMANTGEIHNFVKYGQFSKEARNGRDNGRWGLPPEYAGFKIIVEDAVKVTTRPVAAATAGTRGFIKSDNSAILCSRKGGIDGVLGGFNWSTFQLFWYKWQMAVHTEHDAWNLKMKGRVVDDYSEILAAPETGMLISNVI